MRYAILGDIHSNLQALDAILEDCRDKSVDRFLSVGDVVGYGADPVACIQRLRDIDAIVVAGNHDWAVVGKLDTSYFNAYAKAAVDWTASILQPEHKKWLSDRPLIAVMERHVTVVHATLDAPDQFDYIQSYFDAARSLNSLETPVCFIGHSHVPIAFLLGDSLTLTTASHLDLNGVQKALINVGSIGQPRDENPKAAYALYDSNLRQYELHRVRYDIRSACERILRVGLPDLLAERLRVGR